MRAEYNSNANPIASLTEEEAGLAYQRHLRNSLKRDPGLFYKYDASDIAQTLRQFKKSFPDIWLVTKIYKTFNLQDCHSYMADELSNRIEFFRRIGCHPLLVQAQENWHSSDFTDSERMDALRKIHDIQSEIYGFPPDELRDVVRHPKYPNGKKPYLTAVTIGSIKKFISIRISPSLITRRSPLSVRASLKRQSLPVMRASIQSRIISGPIFI